MGQFTVTLTPEDNNYFSSNTRYRQLTMNAENVTVNTDNFTVGTQPKVQTFGDGVVRLSGSVVAAGSPSTYYAIGTLPGWCVPQQDSVYPVGVIRAGALTANAVKVNTSGDSVASITVTAAGSYATLPTVTAGSPGVGAILVTHMKAVSATQSTAGSGYAPADTITLTGGTAGTNAILTVATTKVASGSVNAAGTGQVPGDVLTCVGGTFSQSAQFTVATTKVVSATVAAGGSGGTPGTQTVTGTTGTGTPFQASVTVSGGGAITAVLSITVAGSYTVNPTAIANEPVTGASLTGAQLSVVMGVNTATLTRAGSYTVNSSSFTTTSSGSGSGATFNSVLYGVNTVTVSTAGDYTALPSNPVAQGSTSGAGSSAAFTVLWGLLSVAITNGGTGFTDASTVSISGGGGSGGGAARINLDSTVNLQLVSQPNTGDIVYLDSINFIVDSYTSQS